MPITSGTFDDETVELLGGVVRDIWASFTPTQQALVTKDEIARLVMLLAEAGIRDPLELKEAALRSLLSDAADRI